MVRTPSRRRVRSGASDDPVVPIALIGTVPSSVMALRVLPPSEDVMARARAVADQLPVAIDLDEVVLGRARLLGLRSRGRVSAGGSCRLLATRDGWVAVNLARPTDIEAVPAIVEAAAEAEDAWPALERFALASRASDVTDRCQLLDVAAAVLDDPRVDASHATTGHELGRPATGRDPATGQGEAPLRVVDLSSMWAGPLCARLLGLCGMDVTKVESTQRPDGARAGHPDFFEWLHRGHESIALDFEDAAGRIELARLVAQADVVIESSRPRALAQLGIDAEHVVRARPGVTWVSITGYGRHGEAAHRVAFGDDAAVAGGLVGRDDEGLPVFCGDAVADPMSGLYAAATAFRSVSAGGGHLVEISMAAVAKRVAHAAG
jgi:hypothetical protein